MKEKQNSVYEQVHSEANRLRRIKETKEYWRNQDYIINIVLKGFVK